MIDDDQVYLNTVKNMLNDDFIIDIYTTSKSGINGIKSGNHNILILDFFIDDLNGSEVTEIIREFNKDIYIIILTGYSGEIPPMKALKEMDVQDYCEKDPHDFENILVRVESAIKSIEKIETAKNLPENIESFAHRLKRLRESKKELQKDLADVLGVTNQAISAYESGRNEPGYKILKKISKHYGVSIDYLLSNKLD
jgi:FixJ family two-component response regulator